MVRADESGMFLGSLDRAAWTETSRASLPIQRFYAESRGLDAAEAERMIVRGFFEQVIAKIPVEPVRTTMLAALAERIGHSEAFDEAEAAA